MWCPVRWGLVTGLIGHTALCTLALSLNQVLVWTRVPGSEHAAGPFLVTPWKEVVASVFAQWNNDEGLVKPHAGVVAV